MPTKIAHFINLHSTGGVECNYAELLNHKPAHLSLEHAVFSTKPQVSRPLAEQLEGKLHTHTSHHYLANKKIPNWPKSLRRKRQQWLLEQFNPDITILWNKLTGINPSLFQRDGKSVYYERSRAWVNHSFQEEKNTLLSVDQIICNSNASKRLLALKYDLPSSINSHVCLNAVRPSCVPANADVRTLSDTKTVGFAGRLTGIKGLASLIHAVNVLREQDNDIKLLIAGKGPDRDSMQALINHLNLGQHIQLLGNVDDMSHYYHQIDLLVVPSIREAFGMSIAESLAHGVPVICTEVDGTTEVFIKGENSLAIKPTLGPQQYSELGGSLSDWPEFVYSPSEDAIVDPKALDPDTLAQTIATLLNDPQQYSTMSERARAHAINKLDYTAHVENLYQLLL